MSKTHNTIHNAYRFALLSMVVVAIVAMIIVSYAVGQGVNLFSRAAPTPQTLSEYGVLDVTNPPGNLPKARGDGVTDDTAALQTLIDYAYNNSMVPLFPEGTYIVTDTLHMNQDAYKGDRHEKAHQLIGSTKGRRPIIRLKSNTPGFNKSPINAQGGVDLSKIKYILDYRSLCSDREISEGAQACGTDFEGARSIIFNNGIRNIEIQTGTGNTGAIGLNFPASQYSFIEDVSIIVGEGFAGMANVPGLGSVTGNIYIEGGEYGVYNRNGFAHTNNTTFTNITLKDQRRCSVFELVTSKPVTIAGFRIEKDAGPVICGNNSDIALVDGTIELRNGNANQVLITNTDRRSQALYNVYIKNGKNYYQYGTETFSIPQYQAGKWYHVTELFSLADSSPKPAIINGSIVSSPKTRVGTISSVSSPPEGLGAKHSWGAPDQSPDQLVEFGKNSNITGVCNAKDSAQVVGDGAHDDGAGLQALLNDPKCKTVFLPRGRYYTTQTLTIRDGTTLIGITPRLTEIVPFPNGFNSNNTGGLTWKARTRTPIVTTVNDANAAISMRNIRFYLPTSPKDVVYFIAFDWRAGRKSILKDIITRPLFGNEVGATAKPDILFSGNAGGRWWGTNSISTSERAAVAQHRRLLVENVHGPLVFYNYNVEDGWAAKADKVDGWQSEVVNSQNVAIFGGKFEDDNGIRFRNSTNILVFSLDNTEMQMQWDNGYTGAKDSLWAIMTSKINPTRGSFTEKNGGSTVKVVLDYPLSLYIRGAFDYAPFDFGQSNQNPTPTNTQTPIESPTHTLTPTLTPIATLTPLPSPSLTPTTAPGRDLTITPTRTPTPTLTIAPIATATSVPTPEACPNFQNGNANCDIAGVIDIQDYLCWMGEFQTGTAPAGCTSADFDGTGGVTIVDYAIWARSYTSIP